MSDLLTAQPRVSGSDAGDRAGAGRPSDRSRPPRRWLARAAAVWPYSVTLLVLAVLYGRTLQRTAGNSFSVDTTKFDYLGLVIGTAHPPGYPLYTMADALSVRLVPFGTIAFRANLLSAVCAVLACLGVVDVLRRLSVRAGLAAGGAIAIGLIPAIWQFAVVAEVYTMVVLFVVAVLVCLVRYDTGGSRHWLRAGVLVLALSFAHSTVTVLLVPGLLIYLLLRRVGWLFRPVELLRLLPTSAALALLPYTYLFWRTAAHAAFLDVRVDSLASFVAVVTGQRYGPLMFAVPDAELPGRWQQFTAAALTQFGPLLWLAAAGLVVFAVRLRVIGVVLSAWVICTVVFTLDYDVGDWLTMLLPLWLLFGIGAVVGADGLIELMVRLARNRRGIRAVAPLVAVVAGATLAVDAAVAGYAAADRSGVDQQAPVDKAITAVGTHAVVFTSSYGIRHQFLYRLLPGHRGQRADLWVAKGGVWEPGPDHNTAQIRSYCAATSAPWVWSVQEQAVGPGVPLHLRTFVYGRGYAHQVSGEGLKVRHVSGGLYRLTCPG